ncbi:uncharacterized protein LOC100373984 [Saccoglossus kowalevskii]|uniref:Eukaryotic translation initiation factor 3 subunit A-like n=1 Tax=Saccoglossus kowalevskii TaxID=10224 RepID=A0ABM0GWT4_SACKO|nr:PREDICTED: eukaryotic translation initiation factor 3 subunit A-like [Saccoglossus kowalevskii]
MAEPIITEPLKSPSGMSFDLTFDIEEENRSKSNVPKRLSQLMMEKENKTPVSPEELDEKLKKAEERRKEQEKARLERIHAREEECRKITEKFGTLLAQDGKLEGEEDGENVKAMSIKQAATVIHNVTQGLNKMGANLKHDTSAPSE